MGQLYRAPEKVHREQPEQCPRLGRTLDHGPSLTSNPGVAIGGAIDIGSNSVHLLAAIIGPGWVEPLRDASELLGLGDVVDRNGDIPADARAEVIGVLRSYIDTAHRSHAEHVTLIGTDPLRRASNARQLVDEIAGATGLTLRVVTEREEAMLTFMGVSRGDPPASSLIVVDIGGGSTEVALWTPGGPLRVDSLRIGSGRLTNAVVKHDPPTEEEIDRLFRMAADATRGLGGNGPELEAAGGRARAVFVGGTATNVARLGKLTRDALAEDRRTVARLSLAQVSARYNVRPRRARQMAAGVAIVNAVLEAFGLDDADVSEASLRDGAIICAARFGGEWPGAMEKLLAG